MSVIARIEPRVIPTYPTGEPEKNPVFFEKRVYQGSNGKVYPVPFIDKVYDEPVDVTYQSVLLENDFVRLVILPEIGGRIFIGQDKTNNDYDFFYRQDVIKPALVGLAGPWISGGVEFNWPQHHRPGTFMPADVSIEVEDDGSRTVWLSEHDPLNRLKGMHGIRLRPDSSLIELRARLFNRTNLTHTFLWWANVAAKVHDQYQSFFPEDVHYIADHAVRATSSFPVANNPYYGIDYQNLDGKNDLSWYKNISVPTSYMVCQTGFDFFGGYDFLENGGFVHVANRHIAPGKKQWTWGDDKFGWAWDRELTDDGGPYVELMAGVFTDNQPDFSYLLPYETKTFSQFWWPIQNIGPVQQANTIVALACSINDDKTVSLGLCVAEKVKNARLAVVQNGSPIAAHTISLRPGESWQDHSSVCSGGSPTELSVKLIAEDGTELLSYQVVDRSTLTRDRDEATEPLAPEDITSVDELYFTGEHLEQYRHPTRDPELYWLEALKRDSGDARCHISLGKRALGRGELAKASSHLGQAIKRLTCRHLNAVTGEAHYFQGLALRGLGKSREAYTLFYKAIWNYEWRASAYYQLATMDCHAGDWQAALGHIEQSLDTNRQNNKAFTLKAVILRHIGREVEAASALDDVLRVDSLDHWARYEKALLTDSIKSFLDGSRNDAQTALDLVFEYCESGFYLDAIAVLETHHCNAVRTVSVPNPLEKTPMTRYALAWLKFLVGEDDGGAALANARVQSADHFFPSRIEESIILRWSIEQDGDDVVACYALGNFLFDKRRHLEAIEVWEVAVEAGTTIPQVYRNLGIAYWNHQHDGDKSADFYQKALLLDPTDTRVISEYDQLAKKRNQPLDKRLNFLEKHRESVLFRDDATVELASLYNLSGRPQQALSLVTSRPFHPWEGGEGAVLEQYTAAHILLGCQSLAEGAPDVAFKHFSEAMNVPESLGEAYHPLQAKADVNYWLGRSLSGLGRSVEAADHFLQSAEESGDFSGMAVIDHSPLSYYRGLSLRELGKEDEAAELFQGLLDYGKRGLEQIAKIDYFATSLPNLLVFDENLQARSDSENNLLVAMAYHGLGDQPNAEVYLEKTFEFTNTNRHAVDLQRSLNSAT